MKPAVFVKDHLFQRRAVTEGVVLYRRKMLRDGYPLQSAFLETTPPHFFNAVWELNALKTLASAKRSGIDLPKLRTPRKRNYP